MQGVVGVWQSFNFTFAFISTLKYIYIMKVKITVKVKIGREVDPGNQSKYLIVNTLFVRFNSTIDNLKIKIIEIELNYFKNIENKLFKIKIHILSSWSSK